MILRRLLLALGRACAQFADTGSDLPNRQQRRGHEAERERYRRQF